MTRRGEPCSGKMGGGRQARQRDLAGRRFIVDDVDTTLACDGNHTVLVAKVKAPREPHPASSHVVFSKASTDGPAPRNQISKWKTPRCTRALFHRCSGASATQHKYSTGRRWRARCVVRACGAPLVRCALSLQKFSKTERSSTDHRIFYSASMVFVALYCMNMTEIQFHFFIEPLKIVVLTISDICVKTSEIFAVYMVQKQVVQ